MRASKRNWNRRALVEPELALDVLRFQCRGASPHSVAAAYAFGLEYIVLLRLEDLTGYRVMPEKLKAGKAN